MMHSGGLIKYKMLGTALVLTGLFLVAKLGQNILGLALMFVGFYLAMKKGIKPE